MYGIRHLLYLLKKVYCQNLICTLVKQAIDNEFMFTRLFNILHLYCAQYTDVLLDIKTHLLQTEQAIQTLLQGYLPYYFVPPEDLHAAIQTIGHELSKIGPFRLRHILRLDSITILKTLLINWIITNSSLKFGYQ